jgi:hypothetical protein
VGIVASYGLIGSVDWESFAASPFKGLEMHKKPTAN